MTIERPDFYLVGAPKCGTSALYEFLREHPQVFLPEKKELLRFASDLSYPTRLSDEEFLLHFAERGGEARAGTAHTAYMQSSEAAEEIKRYRPDADILIMVRNPVDMLHSWHSELLYETIEDIADFEEALEAEEDRRQGLRVPPNARNSYVESLFYSEVASFSAQVERYIDAFGRAHVHVIVHDDLRSKPEETYRATLEFLAVDPDHVPAFAEVNANKAVRSRALQRLYFGTASRGHSSIRNLIPRRVRRALLDMNARHTTREPMSIELDERLRRQFRSDVGRLGRLIDRDLSGWVSQG